MLATGVRRPDARRLGSALCFTGGVDSFHALLSTSPPEALVFAQGFDVKLDDERRLGAVEASTREVAAAVGIEAIVVRSNLREHATFTTAGWEVTHGAALAGLGHLLSNEYGAVIVSSTHARDDLRPWGSDWRLDPLWSSADLAVEHRGAEVAREAKVRRLAQHPLVRAHLRVCWEHRDERLNCSRCDKCLAAMVTLHSLGQLEHFATFDGPDELVERLDQLRKTRYLAMYPRMLAQGIPAPVADAVRRLVARSAK